MRVVIGTSFLILSLAVPAPVLAVGEESFGNAPVVQQPGWAEGVIDVVNLKSRVYSQWVNGNENFFYRGDARALNDALGRFAAVKDDGRRLVLLPGPGKTHTFGRTPLAFDWQLHVPSGIYKAVSKRTHVVMTVYVNVRKPRRLAAQMRRQIAKWLAELDHSSYAKREKARKELEQLGRQAKPLLCKALQAQPGLEGRRRIESLLAKMRGIAVSDLEIPKEIKVSSVDELVAVHVQGLKAADSTVRGLAVQDLSTLARYSDKVVPALTALLKKEKHQWVRQVLAGCLAHLGVRAKSALPALKEGLKDSDAAVRRAFQTAIEQLQSAMQQPQEAKEIQRQRAILKDIRELMK